MVSTQVLEAVYVVFSLALIVAGLTMVGFAVRAYLQTEQSAMFYLSVGFTFIVAAAIATTFSAFVGDFSNTRVLLTVNYAITTVGYVFVIYSVVGTD
jgi:tellurite resistance protein TehA-like permease